jgi:hypothetical protein
LPQISRLGLTGPAVIMLGRVFAAALAATELASAPACRTA